MRWGNSRCAGFSRGVRFQRHGPETSAGDDVILEQDHQAAQLLDLDEAQRYERFDRLQRRMPDVWARMRRHTEGESVVVIPSVDRSGDSTGSMVQAFEERFLFLLLSLRQPKPQMTTSRPCRWHLRSSSITWHCCRSDPESRVATTVHGVDR